MVRSPVGIGVVVGGTAVALGLAVTAQLRSGQSLAAGTPFWLVPAAVGVLGLLAVWGACGAAPVRRRVLGAVVLAAGAAALLTRVWRFVDPDALPGAFTTTRPLVLEAFAVLTALGLLVLVLPPRGTTRRAPLSAGAAAVVVLVVAALGAAATVAVAQRRNVAATGPAAPPRAAGAPVLDGGLAWQATGGAGDRFAVTGGGVAQYLRDGVRVLDPATGAQRWTYTRRDVRASALADRQAVVSAEGTHLVAATAVLDATGGAALGSIPAARDASLGERTYWVLGDTALVVSEYEGPYLTAYTLTGRARWTRPFEGCVYLDAQPAPGGDIVTNQFCGNTVDSYWVSLLDGRTGAVRWRQRVGPAFQLLPGDARRIVLATRQSGELVVRRLNPANGSPQWTVRLPTAPGSGQFQYTGYRVLYPAGGALVVPNPAGPASATLTGIDPETGRVAWTDANLLALVRPKGGAPTAVAPTVTLPDGRTVLLSGTAGGTGLAVRLLDPRTGATTAPRPVALPPGVTASLDTVTPAVSHGALLLTGLRSGDRADRRQFVCRLR